MKRFRLVNSSRTKIDEVDEAISQMKPKYKTREYINLNTKNVCRPVAGGGAGGARAPPEIFRLELNSSTKVEFFY